MVSAIILEFLCSAFGFYGCSEFHLSNGEEKREVLFLVYSDQYALSTMDVFPQIYIFFATLKNCIIVGFFCWGVCGFFWCGFFFLIKMTAKSI